MREVDALIISFEMDSFVGGLCQGLLMKAANDKGEG